MSKKVHTYCYHLGTWRIYSPDGTVVSYPKTKEEAKTETYRLNGWKLKDSKT